jgi:opacity protein-like surface antigen
MKNMYNISQSIRKYEQQMEGVFTISDLQNIINEKNNVVLSRKIRAIEENKIIFRFCKGYYITENFSIETLSAKINPESYISFGYILAKELIIGSIPKYTLPCVKLGRKREYANSTYKIKYFTIKQDFFFGYQIKAGVKYASKEKAFLDVLYYYQKGTRFSFDIFSDINIERLNINTIYEYLKKYKNPKFIQFVKGYLDARI